MRIYITEGFGIESPMDVLAQTGALLILDKEMNGYVEIAHAPTAAQAFLNLHLAGYEVKMDSPIHDFTIHNEWVHNPFAWIDEEGEDVELLLSEEFMTALCDLEQLPF
mgnify:CR=1 FL=1